MSQGTKTPGPFAIPPKGSTVYQELEKGRICARTGHLGHATIEKVEGVYVVTQKDRKAKCFDRYWAAIGYFNRCVGKTSTGG